MDPNKENIKNMTWKERPIKNLSKEELIKALHHEIVKNKQGEVPSGGGVDDSPESDGVGPSSAQLAKSDSSAIPAAGPWQKGEPDKEDDYLIKYTTHKQTDPRISTGRYLPDQGWLNIFPGMDIIEYAELNK